MQLKKYAEKFYQSVTSGRTRNLYIKIDSLAQKYGGKYYDRTIRCIKHKIKFSVILQDHTVDEASFSDLCWSYGKKEDVFQKPLVSIIVPNYNNGLHLRERLENIYHQTYQNFEVILLDDASTDDSQHILMEYAKKFPANTTVIMNQTHNGQQLSQWNKGLKVSRGALIWIAECDTSCRIDFLAKMVKLFLSSGTKMAFSKSALVQGTLQSQKPEAVPPNIDFFEWDTSFYMTAHNMVKHCFAFHNVIPSISSVIFRNTGEISDTILTLCKDMKYCGTWIFYLYTMQGGIVGYTSKAVNNYRTPTDSNPRRVPLDTEYYKEVEAVSCYVAKHYNVQNQVFDQMLHNLTEQFQTTHSVSSGELIKQYYSLEKILPCKNERMPNLLMTCYALKSGGGETYPIYLANEMSRRGFGVTLLNFNIEDEEENIRSLVKAEVPIITIKSIAFLKTIITQLGGEVIHSHHASVDEIISQCVNQDQQLCRHIITLHGMYETIRPEDCDRIIASTWKSCSKFIYIADKNLDCFISRKYIIDQRFIKLPNGLPVIPLKPIDRKTLNIPDNAFILTTASRGITEKGWKEAIAAVIEARQHCVKPIHLVIAGDGDVRAELERTAPDYIHFVGTRSNVRDYYAMADAGLMPSYFKGESYPLTVMECLMAGTPVIATDIAEVKNQLKDDNGQLAGILVPIRDWKIDIKDICAAILALANDQEYYLRLKKRTESASRKFDITRIADRYLQIYKKV